MLRAAFLVLVACGRIGFDATGDGGTTLGMTDLDLASGDQFSCAIRPDRSVVCWGDGRKGQLATGVSELRSEVVPTVVTGAKRIDAGLQHACALLEDGRLVCWGQNHDDQLGRPEAMLPLSPTPVEITGLPSPVAKLALGDKHTCVVLEDQTLWCWGRNGDGECGVQTSPTSPPTQVLDQVIAASGGDAFTCAVRSDHSVWCWGNNDYYQLGDMSSNARYTPEQIAGFTADDVSCGDKHTCARVGGRYSCWGYNNSGELGDGTSADRKSPAPLSALTNVVQIDAGNDHTCVLLDDGRVACFGLGVDGAIGSGLSTRTVVDPTFALVTGATAKVATGGEHTCAMRSDGSVACWGVATSGQLANGQRGAWEPVEVTIPGGGAASVFANGRHVCANTGTQVYCWGDNTSGELGNNSAEDVVPTPTLVAGLAPVNLLALGNKHTCATIDPNLYCWGGNAAGELGDGTKTKRPVPTLATVTNVNGLGLGDGFSCAALSADTVCFGRNEVGQLGDLGASGAENPNPVSTGTGIPVVVTAGERFACALSSAATIQCWGANARGQLGRNTRTAMEAPLAIVGTWDTVAAAGLHACAIDPGGGVLCWGANDLGEVGDGTLSDREVPTAVTNLNGNANLIAVGRYHSCARTQNGVYCWGQNLRGELGDGTGLDRNLPAKIASSINVTSLAAGHSTTCARDMQSKVWCWGDNTRGQLGQGTVSRSLSPVEINFP